MKSLLSFLITLVTVSTVFSQVEEVSENKSIKLDNKFGFDADKMESPVLFGDLIYFLADEKVFVTDLKTAEPIELGVFHPLKMKVSGNRIVIVDSLGILSWDGVKKERVTVDGKFVRNDMDDEFISFSYDSLFVIYLYKNNKIVKAGAAKIKFFQPDKDMILENRTIQNVNDSIYVSIQKLDFKNGILSYTILMIEKEVDDFKFREMRWNIFGNAVTAGNKLYFVTKEDQTYYLSSSSDSICVKLKKLNLQIEKHSFPSVASVDGKIYILIGQENGSFEVHIYDPETTVLKTLSSNSIMNGLPTFGIINGQFRDGKYLDVITSPVGMERKTVALPQFTVDSTTYYRLFGQKYPYSISSKYNSYNLSIETGESTFNLKTESNFAGSDLNSSRNVRSFQLPLTRPRNYETVFPFFYKDRLYYSVDWNSNLAIKAENMLSGHFDYLISDGKINKYELMPNGKHKFISTTKLNQLPKYNSDFSSYLSDLKLVQGKAFDLLYLDQNTENEIVFYQSNQNNITEKKITLGYKLNKDEFHNLNVINDSLFLIQKRLRIPFSSRGFLQDTLLSTMNYNILTGTITDINSGSILSELFLVTDRYIISHDLKTIRVSNSQTNELIFQTSMPENSIPGFKAFGDTLLVMKSDSIFIFRNGTLLKFETPFVFVSPSYLIRIKDFNKNGFLFTFIGMNEIYNNYYSWDVKLIYSYRLDDEVNCDHLNSAGDLIYFDKSTGLFHRKVFSHPLTSFLRLFDQKTFFTGIADSLISLKNSLTHAYISTNYLEKNFLSDFRYRFLSASDTTWSEYTRNNYISFAGLDPGWHTIEYQAKVEGQESEVFSSKIYIHPKWYQTTTARVGYGLSVAGVLFGLLSFQSRRLKRLSGVKQTEALKAQEHQRRQEELNNARRVQLSLLPSGNFEKNGWLVTGKMVTATEVGGDFYDFIEVNNRWICVALGDATGHGMSAGLMVSMIKMAFVQAAKNVNENSSSSDLLRNINETLRSSMKERGLGMCLSLTLIDQETGLAKISSTALPYPYHWKSESKTIEAIELHGPPLGFISKPLFREKEIQLNPGDLLILMSDGLPERSSADDSVYGYEKLEEELLTILGDTGNASEIITQVFSKNDTFAAGKANDDDMTVVVVRKG